MKKAVLFFIVGFISCTPGLLKKKLSPDFSLQRIEIPEKYRHYGAVVLKDEGFIELKYNSKVSWSDFTRIRAVKILDKNGYQYANVLIPFSGDSRVSVEYAYTLAPDGCISQVQPEDIYEIPLYPRYVFYSDQKAKIFTFPNVVPGSIVVYKYKIHYSFLTATSGWNFQEKVPVLDSKFTIEYPSGLPLHYKEYDLQNEPVKINNPPGFKNRISWHETFVDPIKIEINMPPSRMVARRVAFSPIGFDTWGKIGEWYRELFYPMAKLTGVTDSITEEIRKEKGTIPEEKLFYWLQKQIRYIAVEIGVGRFQPHQADEVLQKKYGDCKDMVVCATALGRKMGVEVIPVLIPFRDYAMVDPEQPTPGVFNHLIGLVIKGNDSVFVDFTSKTTPFGKIPWYLQGQSGLLILPKDSARLIQLPVMPASANMLYDSAIVELNGNQVRVTGTMIFTGSAGDDINSRMIYREKEEKKIYCENLVLNSWKNLEISKLTFHSYLDSLRIDYSGRIPIVDRNGEQYILFNPGDELYFKMQHVFVDSLRMWDILLKYKYNNKICRKIILNDGWDAIISKMNYRKTSDFGVLSYSVQQSDSLLIYELHHQNNRIYIKKKEYNRFRNFLKGISELNQQYILLHRSKNTALKKEAQN